MWTLETVTLVVCLTLGWLINAVLFAQWRVRPLYRFLYRHSSWYRRWIFAQTIRSMNRLAASFAAVVPAARRATEAFQDFGDALRVAAMRER